MTARPPTTVWCVNCKESFSDIWAYKRHQDECTEAGKKRRLSEDRCTLVADDDEDRV